MNHNDEIPRSSAFTPPAIIRDSSAFSRALLPSSSSSLLSPKPNGVCSTIGSNSDPTRYRECLRNHAASAGGHVTDGCGEFMPASPTDPLKCAACGCHRSFHRRQPEPIPESDNTPYRVPLLLPPPNPLRLNYNTTSSSEERNPTTAGAATTSGGGGGRRKRFRTKFSGEQKERMKGFAEGIGWRVQRKDEVEMERFCSEIGVNKQVLKVWMHNNKHLVSKKQEEDGNINNVKVEGERASSSS